jgi:hypothetical protein
MPPPRRQDPNRRPAPHARSSRMVHPPPQIHIPLPALQRRGLGPTARSHQRIGEAVRERAGYVCTRRRGVRAAVEQFLGRR